MEKVHFTRISALWLVVACGAVLVRELGGPVQASAISGGCVLVYLAMEWRQLPLECKVVSCAALAVAVFAWTGGQLDEALIIKAMDRGAFLVFFLTSLAVLREAASSSRLIRNCGKVLVEQPPNRRYYLMTSGGHLIGLMLSVGALNVLGVMVQKAAKSRDGGERENEVHAIRERRMLLAILRGFSAIPIWSPISISMVLILASYPRFSWLEYAPIGCLACILYLGWGSVLDRASGTKFRRGLAATSSVAITPMDGGGRLKTLIPLVALIALIPTMAYFVLQVFDVTLLTAILMSAPLVGVAWVGQQYRRAGFRRMVGLLRRRLVTSFPQTFSGQRAEISIFASAGFAGVILIPIVDPHDMGQLIINSGLASSWLLIFASWLIVGLSFVGINPIISITIVLGVYSQLPQFEEPSTILALMIGVTYAVIAGSSSMTTSVRLLSYFAKQSAFRIGLDWNGGFSLGVLVVLDAVILIFGSGS